MPNVSATVATWSGFTGAPGYTKFYWEELVDPAGRQAAVDTMRAFFVPLQPILRVAWSVSFSNLVQTFDVGTSKLVSESAAGSSPAAVPGTVANTVAFAGGVGGVIKWTTGAIFEGRHQSGRTFIVPTAGAHDTDGTLNPTAVTAMGIAVTALLGNSTAHAVVWSKRYDRTTTPPVQIAGQISRITGGVPQDRTATLRSRRV